MSRLCRKKNANHHQLGYENFLRINKQLTNPSLFMT